MDFGTSYGIDLEKLEEGATRRYEAAKSSGRDTDMDDHEADEGRLTRTGM